MAFFRQLRLLLWKNGLGIIRRPLWSVTLVLWPIIIFVIIAVTRHQFPPVLRNTCYVGPRNLPSTGFFPFLETLMCNTDSDCHNTSRLAHPKHPSRTKRSVHPPDSTPSLLIKGKQLKQYLNPDNDPSELLNTLNSVFGSPKQSPVRFNQTMTGDQPMVNLTESAKMFKSVICTLGLPLVQTPSPDYTAAAFINFCNSNNTAFEVAINTIDQILVELMTSRPEELAKLAEEGLKLIDQLQNDTLLWEGFLSLPQLFNPTSPDQLLEDLGKLMINLQKILKIIEHTFPEVKPVTSPVHPFLLAAVKITEYMMSWPGKAVSVRFGDVVTGNESLWQMVADIEIPLDKAIILAFDRKVVLDFVCKNSSGPTWVAACATGSLDMLLGWISPNKLAQQILLAWSKSVAQQDLAVIKGIVHSLTGLFESSAGMERSTRSIKTQPQNIEEELFLEIGKVALEIVQLSPEVYAIFQDILRVGFLSMKTGTQAIETVEEMMQNVVKDVTTIKMIFQTLATNESQTTIWISQALGSISDITAKLVAGDSVTCDIALDQFGWVFSINTIKRELVRGFLCGDANTTEQILLNDWLPLAENAKELYGVFMRQAKYDVSLPMVLSEWHMLLNKSLGFGGFFQDLAEEWSGKYWADWMSESSSANHLPSSLQQSVWPFMMKLGLMLERSVLWPEAKNYFQLALWILNSTDTSQPNCTMNMKTFGIKCDMDFDWYRFSEAITTLLSPNEEVFISCLKRSVRLLQHVYSDFYKHLAASNIKNAIQGGDMLSAFLINMLNKVDEFAQTLTTLPNQRFANPQFMGSLYASLLESIGLKPLLPLILHKGPVNVSLVLEAAADLGRFNQAIFTFNESDPTLPDLEKHIKNFLSMEGKVSMSVYLTMSHTLLTYSSHFSKENVAVILEALKPLTNQTSSGLVEIILRSIELLKTIMDPPNGGDSVQVILALIRQLQQFLVGLFPIDMTEQSMLLNGTTSSTTVTKLQILSDVINLLTPEMIMSLTNAGPVTAQHMIIQKYIQSLPLQVRTESAKFLKEFVALQNELAKCHSGQDCLTGIAEMLDILDQILDMTLGFKGNVTINIASTKMYMGSKQLVPVASAFISFVLHPIDAANVKTVQESLQFISVLLRHPNITLSNVQEALKQSNLTIQELNELMMWLGAKDVNDLLDKLTKLQNAQECFEQTSPVSAAHCAVGTVTSITDLLEQLPTLQNYKSIIAIIPNIVNKTVTDMINTNFISPQNVLAESLKVTLANVRMTLRVNNLSDPEIENEMDVLESLINLVGNPEPLKDFNLTSNGLKDATAALQLVHWYLEKCENVTSNSSASDLLYPFYRITQMQVALQLAQLDMNQFISEQMVTLTNSLKYPIDAEGVVQISNTTTAILEHVVKFVIETLKTQNAPAAIFGYDPPINMTVVNATVMQINNYITLLQQWMIQANFGVWGNINYTSVVENDIYHLIKSTLHFFKVDQRNYLRAISNITKALDNALQLAMQPNGLQSERFSQALLEAVQSAMDLLIQINGNLPLSIQQSVLTVIKNSVWLAVHPEASYGASLNATLQILNNLQFLMNQIFPGDLAQYPVGALKIVTTYFESVATVYGPDSVNWLVLNEMETFESLFPPNSSAQHYISTIINVTKAILQPIQGNQSLSLDPSGNISEIVAEAEELWNMLCPLFMEDCMQLNGQFSNTLQQAVQIMVDLLGQFNAPLPLSVPQSILSVIKNSVWLAVDPEASYAMSLNSTLHILQNLQVFMDQVFPQDLVQYPVGALKLVTTYFDSVATVYGPDSVNLLILNEMETLESLFPPNSSAQHYISTIINVTKAILQPIQGNRSHLSLGPSEEMIPVIIVEVGKLLKTLCPLFLNECMQENGPQRQQLSQTILETVQITMDLLVEINGSLPFSIPQSILSAIRSSVWLAVNPEASYAMSLNTTLHILQNLEVFMHQVFPQDLVQYPVSALQLVTTYFESVATVYGPDSVNLLILKEMETIKSLFPLNSTAVSYISTIIGAIKSILQPVQGSQSHLSLVPSEEMIPVIIAEVGNLWNMLCPQFLGESCKPLNASSLRGFADLPRVLEKLMTGQANNQTWRRLQEFVEVLLSFIETEVSADDFACLVEMFENVVGAEVKNRKAQTDLIVGLQVPVMTLITDLTRSANGSRLNVSEIYEGLQMAIEHTVKAIEKTNGTSTCQEVLKLWEPVRLAAGLSSSFIAMWCNISLQPVIDTYAYEMSLYNRQNWTCTEMGSVTAEAVAERMVMTLLSVYDAEIKQSVVIEQLVQALSTQFSALLQQPLSHEAMSSLSEQFQLWQIQSSLQSLQLLSKELEKEFPAVKPYMEAVVKLVNHILKNSSRMDDMDTFKEASMILLSSLNISAEDINQIMSGTLSSKAVVGVVIKAIKTLIDMKVFGDNPMLYHTLNQLLASNDTRMFLHKVTDMVSWLTSTEARGIDLIVKTLNHVQQLLTSLLSVLTNMEDDLPPYLQVLHDLTDNAISFIQQLLSSGSIPMGHRYNVEQHTTLSHNTSRIRRRREASFMPVSPFIPASSPMDDMIDLFYIDYPTLGRGLEVVPTTSEFVETFHVLFANQDLKTVLKGATKDLDWTLDFSKEEMIDAALGMASILTIADLDYSSLDIWANMINLLPDGFPYASLLKNITRVITSESQENLQLMQRTFNTVTALFYTNLTDPQLLKRLELLRTQVCDLEKTKSVQMLLQGLSLEPGTLCNGIVPGIQLLAKFLLFDVSTMVNDAFDVLVGEPRQYQIQTDWTSVLTQVMGLNVTVLKALNLTSAVPVVTIGEMVRNKAAFMSDLEKLGFEREAVVLLTEAPLPDNNLQSFSWFVHLRKCDSMDPNEMGEGENVLTEKFCSMNATQWYSFTLLMAQHLNTEKFIYKMVLPMEIQSLVQTMLQMAATVINMMKRMLPAVHQLEEYLISIESLSLTANNEFRQTARSQRTSAPRGATFVTISRALCSQGILAVFGAANHHVSLRPPTFDNNPKREEMIERFKIPRDATPFCTNMYLDMVNTTGGAIAWAFLKPMLMGKILFTPDTPQTRAIMIKANSTLQQLADLRHYSQDWIQSSDYIVKSSATLSQTLPMLKNSLGNSFVKNFIEMQTGINVDSMRETLNNFANMTSLLEQNKDLLGQISTLSKLMIDLSSCITFDRYQGYDAEDELNKEAQALAKNRDLYASVIFKLPKVTDSSRKRRSASGATRLPPKVRYTIRMHMDNLMRTDRTREPFFTKDTHISARQTLRYNRGFVYLQETIDRAIIDIQANKTVSDTAVQIQPFPYPCHHRDEYLEAISFVFPLLLMIAWVLFVADFVKNLVHEREMRLHEYMKMMGVSPFSHFFAWFLESAFFLFITISILTFVLKFGKILPHSDGFLLFLYLCDYGLSILAFSFLVSTFFDKAYIAALSGSLLYVLSFFPFIAVMALEARFSFSAKSFLGLFSPTAFSYASQYVSRYETQGEGIQWSNSYSSPIAGDSASFGWLCWLMLIDTFLYFIVGAYIRAVFPGKSGIPSPWYFPFKASFWKRLCGCSKSKRSGRGLFLTNIMQAQPPVFPDSDGKGKGKGDLSSKARENFSDLPVGVALYGLTKVYGQQPAIENLNIAFYEGHVTSLLGHNGAGKTTTMSILTGLFPPSSGVVEVYGRDMQANLEDVRQDLGVCMQYDVLFEHMTTKEHLLLYGQIKAPHWSERELQEQVRTILEETGMYAHRHKRVGTLSGGMKRKLSISIAFIGGSRLVVLDEPTTGVDPCSRRSIWDIVIQHKKGRTIIMSTHHLDEAEVLSDRIAFLERGGLKCCGSPYSLKDQLGQGYKLTLTKRMHNGESKQIDGAELKAFVQAHVPEARLKEAQGSDLVYLLPQFSSNNASSYRSLLTALDSNLDALQLSCYGISDTTLEEVFLHLTHGGTDAARDELPSISETVSDTESINSFSDSEGSNHDDTACFTRTQTVSGVKLAWQQMTAILIKRLHHSRRDWKGLLSQILLPVLFVAFAMGLGTIKSDLRHYPELELSPALYNVGPSYSFFSDQNSSKLADAMVSFPGLDNACLQKSDDQVCPRSTGAWITANGTKKFSTCKCVREKEVCGARGYVPPHKRIPSSQIVYNVTDLDVENYLVATADDYIRNRYGGYDFGLPLPSNLKMDVKTVPQNRTLSKVWFNPEGHHTMPAYLSSMNNFILRSNLPADKDPSQYAISVSSHPYFGRPDDEDTIIQGMLQIMVTLLILAGYSITAASFAMYVVTEHQSGSKGLQHIAGISEPFYWIVNFFYDMVIYLIPVALTVGVIAAFQVPAFIDRQNLGAVTLLLVLFGFSTFPWMYLLSGVFKDAEMAFITYVCINLFLTVNTIIPTSILYFMQQITYHKTESLKVIFDGLSVAFLIFPQFNFGNGLLELARTNIEVQLLSGYGIDAYKDPFSTESLGWMMISSFIQGVVFFSLRLLWNKHITRKISRLILRGKSARLVPSVDVDEDVAAEHLRVSSGAASADVLQVNQLTKVYQHLNKKVPAVKKLSLGVPAGECFGLLGVNGAGKTTTFKMLTGDVSPTDGTAQIRDRNGRLVDIMECRNQGINIGYCPQVDALDDLLTGEEHLYFYARLHGISKREIPGVVNYLLRRVELNRYRDTIADGYSCGTRRKLSAALALLGHPQILLLDEPSSGMDPRTKRQLWKIITEEVKGKCAVVLTSHSMEECEALCGRLAIMVQGQFRCLGSLQHIKNRFGSGFTVKMYLAKASSDADAITRFMQSRFPSTYLKEQHSAMVEYHVPVAPGGVADIFGQLESSKEYLEIQHFAVSQTTLDEVFINFAMGKIGMETVPFDEVDDDISMKDIEA